MLFILRHGETIWNREDRMQGGLDSPLTDRGRQQALRQGAILAGCGVGGLPLFSSPQGRAVGTAALALPGVVPELDPRLSEVGMGAWQGQAMDSIRPQLPAGATEAHAFLWKFGAPGGETLAAMQARVAEFLAEVPGPAVIVTHGVTSQMLRGLCLGRDVDGMGALEDRQGVVYLLRDGQEMVLEAPPPEPILSTHG
jgi:probable phosphoglycerate mutase